ncbi:MAG: D-arabinono-1,4-lactone oxidase, partial [Alphaproteobacteria bacterium]|nr:D-arabinono-1,4-lactone oxidase [Alphaproteobacteria bacterium]
FPLQQFYLVPWRWSYFIQHRREHDQPRSRLARLYRLYWLGVMDYGLILQILFLERVVRSRRLIRLAFRRIIPAFLIRNWRVTDRSSSMLVMRHDAFRHIEIEVFVRRDKLVDALRFAQETIKVAGGRESTLSADNQQRIEGLGMQEALAELHDQYCHHFPICVRRVLPDDTLISMASGAGEDWYALSFISYARPARRAGFSLFASFMARSMSRLFHARPHWGKVCPLEANELTSLYPKFNAFRTVCNTLDPQGVFQNGWTAALLEADGPAGDIP